jgi:D-threo-aldose 1-dehydrogenase
MLGGVFNSGILATGAIPGARYNYKDAPPEVMARVARIEQVCRAHDVLLIDAALQFALGHVAVSSVVLGAETPEHVHNNIRSMTRPIPSSLWSDLKAEGLLNPEAPTPV